MFPRTRWYGRDATWAGSRRRSAAPRSPPFAGGGKCLRWPCGRRGTALSGSLSIFFLVMDKIGDRLDAQLCRLATAHHQGIRIIEPDRIEPAKGIFLIEPVAHIGIYAVPAAGQVVNQAGGRMEDSQECGTGVFRIH